MKIGTLRLNKNKNIKSKYIKKNLFIGKISEIE